MIDYSKSSGSVTLEFEEGSDGVLDYYFSDPSKFADIAHSLLGHWLLLDRGRKLLFTSAAFQGAYWDPELRLITQKLGEILDARKNQGLPIIDPVGLYWSVSDDIGLHSNDHLQHSALCGVRILQSLVHASDLGGSNALLSLLPQSSEMGALSMDTFEDAMLSSAEEAVAFLKGDVWVSFSGGKDCLSVALALREVSSSDRVKLIHASSPGKGQNTEQARSVARAYGLPLVLRV